MQLDVHGTKGTLRLINDDQIQVWDAQGNETPFTSKEEEFSDVEGEMANLYKVIRHGASLGVSVEEGYHHLAFVVAALDAADNQRVAKVSTL
jgi:predicted dehydrogenase